MNLVVQRMGSIIFDVTEWYVLSNSLTGELFAMGKAQYDNLFIEARDRGNLDFEELPEEIEVHVHPIAITRLERPEINPLPSGGVRYDHVGRLVETITITFPANLARFEWVRTS